MSILPAFLLRPKHHTRQQHPLSFTVTRVQHQLLADQEARKRRVKLHFFPLRMFSKASEMAHWVKALASEASQLEFNLQNPWWKNQVPRLPFELGTYTNDKLRYKSI